MGQRTAHQAIPRLLQDFTKNAWQAPVLLSGGAFLVGSWRYRDCNPPIGKSYCTAMVGMGIKDMPILAAWQGREQAMALGMTLSRAARGAMHGMMAAAKLCCSMFRRKVLGGRGEGGNWARFTDTPARHHAPWPGLAALIGCHFQVRSTVPAADAVPENTVPRAFHMFG